MQRADEGSATLQTGFESAAKDGIEPGALPSIANPVALLRRLDVSGRFHRDGPFGRIYHRGQVSLRENVPSNSLHIALHGNHLSAHVDVVSPLHADPRGRSRYSAPRTVAHNLAGMAHDLVLLLRGRQGDHTCRLDCEWVADEEDCLQGPLLDPAASAWSVQLEARVSGSLDLARLRAALGNEEAVRDRLEVADCPDDEALDAARARLQSMPVPISPPPSLRACLCRRPAGDVLMLNFNHAAIDGPGAMHVLHCIARAYAGDGPTVASLDWMAATPLPVRPSAVPKPAVARLFENAVERLRDAFARPALLAAEDSEDRDGYGFCLLALSAEDTQRLGRGEGSPSDRHALMAALHVTIGEWNRGHGTPGGTVGVLAPVDLRPDGWDDTKIGNFSVVTRISTSRLERRRVRSALREVAVQIGRTQRARSGIALIEALRRSGLLALWAKQSVVVLQPLAANRMIDTAMICNLGWADDPPSFGPGAGETQALWFSPPSRSPLSLCIGAVTIGDRLHLTFRYPHRLFGPAAARRFAECYAGHLRVVADRSR